LFVVRNSAPSPSVLYGFEFQQTQVFSLLSLAGFQVTLIGRFWVTPEVKTKELTVKQINFVPCTTCGAATGEPRELHSGALRLEPHRDRKLSAADALEAKRNKQKLAI
jgi:hypothetical protein